jgi:acyl phosphate:glycerol-3-phosphate acyltransferase
MKTIAIWSILGFLLGSVPFAYVLTMRFMGEDVRHFGDGNPGAMNAWRAGGWQLGLPAIILDFLKGAIPVGLAHQVYGISGWGIVPIALAPILGHAYSPFLGFKGGKAVSVTYGVWAGLLSWQGPLMLAVGQGLFFIFLASDSWVTVLGATTFFGFLVLNGQSTPVLTVVAVNLMVFFQRYSRDLRHGLKPRYNRPFEWLDTSHWKSS